MSRRVRYARLEGGFWKHARTQQLSLAARGVLVSLWSHCADEMTDGYVPRAVFVAVCGEASSKERDRILAELTTPLADRAGVAKPFATVAPGGLQLRGFISTEAEPGHNISASDWQERKRVTADRVKAYRDARNKPSTSDVTRYIVPSTPDVRCYSPDEDEDEDEELRTQKENTEISTSAPAEPPVERALLRLVFDHWVRVMAREPKRTKLTRDREAKIRARLREGYAAEDLCRAIDGCAKSEWHMGANDRQTPFNDLTTICKSAESVDRHIAHLTGTGVRAAPKGVAPARQHHEFNDDDPDEIWGPKAGAAE